MTQGTNNLRLLTSTALLLLVLVSSLTAGSTLSPALEDLRLSPAGSDSETTVDVLVILDDYDVRGDILTAASSRDLDRSERIKSVTSRLQSFSPVGSDFVESFLNEKATGEVTRFWIVPAYSATIPVSALDELSELQGVSLILPNVNLEYDPPVETKQSTTASASSSNHLKMMNVPSVWSEGYTGKGRLVCSFDTGVKWNHPALEAKWRGNHASLGESWFSAVHPDSLPWDATGHGTHTMGLMVGNEGIDSIGVAPGAEFIAAGVVDQGKSLSATLADIVLAFEWSLDPDGDPNTTSDVPDVILNSWGIPAGLFEDCDATFWQVIDNVEAAGVVTIFAAGNEGPDPQTLRDPADRASSPTNTFSVGAVDISKNIASFSSRGPSRCDPTQVKPEIVAPGVSIRSASKDGGYIYMSGTSMAAPYIAGMVALCREYNPDATVEQIKNAFLQAAQDLGDPGEDNTYGNGLIDASLVLDYLPAPIIPEFSVAQTSILGDAIALPGDTVELNIELANPAGNFEQISGRIVSLSDGLDLVQDEAPFFFTNMSTSAVNSVPFSVMLDRDLVHGSQVDVALYLETYTGEVIDSLTFVIPVGYAAPGDVVTLGQGGIGLAISNFGQLGFAPGSIYNVGGSGFRFENSENLLYEAGIVLATDDQKVSHAVRGTDGRFRPSDFSPVDHISTGWMGADEGYHVTGSFVDLSSGSVPVRVLQEAIDYNMTSGEAVMIMRYHLVNESSGSIENLRFGFLADFDLNGNGETVVYDDTRGLIYQQSDNGPIVGVVMLEHLQTVSSMANDVVKTGLSEEDIIAAISSGGLETSGDDMMFVTGSGAMNFASGDSLTVSFALVAGDDLSEVFDNAEIASERYKALIALGGGVALPETFVLEQNYPNPFNPSTTISFSLTGAAEVTLDIYNTLGQKVTQLHNGLLQAGSHDFEWDATSSSGDRVASGVYFYRVSTEEFSEARKMVLLK